MLQKTLLRKCANYNHLAWCVCTNYPLHAILFLVWRLTAPVKEVHSQFLLLQKSVEGAQSWLLEHSRKLIYLGNVVKEFHNPVYTRAAGLMGTTRDAALFTHPLPTGDLIASNVWRYVIKLLGAEILWLGRYVHEPLGVMATLVTDDKEEEGRMLQ